MKAPTFVRSNPCDNRNHSRPNAPVRNCPECGGVVNREIAVKKCNEVEHGALRRRQNRYCIDCGDQLIVVR